ncbi:MAG: Na/Pi symporter [Proteobacteria bacterium]|nr:Na/Pi symporter [Pseudomonadota bacterium]
MELDLWRPAAGLALFLFAMRIIEASLEQVSGKTFRAFVRNNTDSPLKGALTGAAVTALLQSSSLVGLMMLALVGARVVQMRNALAVIFGANLGTTFTGWIVATLGFKLQLESAALPLIAFGGLLTVVAAKGNSHQIGRMILGLGLLLMGLEFMKESLGDISQIVDIETLRSFGPVEFLIFGLVFSALIQSSSATMVVTLSALHAGAIDLPAAAAVAIGADLGTTSTVLLGAIGGSAAKKRVAAGHFLFNLATDLLAFFLLVPLLALVATLGVVDPLMSLVAFHSLFNLMGICIFLPVVGRFAAFLENRFSDADSVINRHLGRTTANVPEPAVEAIELETSHLLQRVIRQNLLLMDPPLLIARGRLPVGPTPATDDLCLQSSFTASYQTTKRLEGEILAFTVDAQGFELDPDQTYRIDRCQRTVREAVHSSKSLKDVEADLRNFDLADHSVLARYGQRFRDVFTEFYLTLFGMRDSDEKVLVLDDFIRLSQLAHRVHDEMHLAIYADIRTDSLDEGDISSLLNTNRELFVSARALISAIAIYVLPAEQLDALETLPESVM